VQDLCAGLLMGLVTQPGNSLHHNGSKKRLRLLVDEHANNLLQCCQLTCEQLWALAPIRAMSLSDHWCSRHLVHDALAQVPRSGLC